MVTQLFRHERLHTTIAKAKVVRRFAERFITQGKNGDRFSRVRAESYILDPPIVEKLFSVLAARYRYRPGGYTRVIRTVRRRGDNAQMAYVELIDRPGELREPHPCGPDYVNKGLAPNTIKARLVKYNQQAKAAAQPGPQSGPVLQTF